MGNRLRDFVIEDATLVRGQIYEKVKQAILSGDIPMGCRLLEGRLAEQLNVSRTPVREALHVLEMEGFLESFPRVGYRVRQITLEEALEIYEIRGVLEPLAARKAIESDDQSYIDLLEQAIAKSETAGKREQLDAFFQYDAAFDEIIVRASGMKTLLNIWAVLRHRLKLYRMGVQVSASIRLKAVNGHRRILKCLKARDQSAVNTAIREHLENFKQDIKRVAFDRARNGVHLPPRMLRKR